MIRPVFNDTEVALAMIVNQVWAEEGTDIDFVKEIIQRWAASLHAASPTTATHHQDWGVQAGLQMAGKRINPPTVPR